MPFQMCENNATNPLKVMLKPIRCQRIWIQLDSHLTTIIISIIKIFLYHCVFSYRVLNIGIKLQSGLKFVFNSMTVIRGCLFVVSGIDKCDLHRFCLHSKRRAEKMTWSWDLYASNAIVGWSNNTQIEWNTLSDKRRRCNECNSQLYSFNYVWYFR